MRCFILALAGLLATSVLQANEPKIRVVTLHTVLTEIAKDVGGDQVEVDPLVRAGVDPHTFQPSPGAIAKMTEADLVLASGLNLEPYLDRLVANVGVRGHVLFVGDALPVILSADGRLWAISKRGEKDPHWWHSIGDMLFATDLIRRELSRMRPRESAAFAARAQAYEENLFALQDWSTRALACLPSEKRQLVTSHDAFSYFARDYGFTIHSINGLTPDGELNARDISRLIDLIKAKQIRAIFPEATTNSHLIQGIVDGTGAKVGPALYADGLGPEGGDASTYQAMFRHNVSAMVASLSGP